jgi:hypothetical protein
MAARAAFRMMDDFHLYFWFQNVWSGMTPKPIIRQRTTGVPGAGHAGDVARHYRLGDVDVAILENNPAGAG